MRGVLPTGKGSCSLWLEAFAGCAAAPSGAIEKAAGGGSFLGFGFQHPTSVLQECTYCCPACYDCFRWGCAERWKPVSGGSEETIQAPSVPRPQRPILRGFAGSAYETTCRLTASEKFMQAIKNITGTSLWEFLFWCSQSRLFQK